MPNKFGNKKQSKTTFKGFINLRLSHNDEQTVSKYAQDRTNDLFELSMKAVQDGFKLSIAFDDMFFVYIISLTGNANAGYLEGYCITFRDDDLMRAVDTLAYLLNEVIPNGGISATNHKH